MAKRVMAFTASGIMLFSLTFLSGCTIVKKETAPGNTGHAYTVVEKEVVRENTKIERYQMAISPGSTDGWSILKLDTTTGQVWRRDCTPRGYGSNGWEEVK